MKFRESSRAKVSIVHLSGKFILENTDEFENHFGELVGKNPQSVAVDCSKLEFIDSSGIGSLLKALNICKRNGIEFMLVAINDNIMNVLKLAKLDLFFTLLNEDEFERAYPEDDDIDSLIDSL